MAEEIKNTENQIKDPNLLSEQESKQWIKETSLKSWEPELLISGVAIYLTVNLPRLLQWLYDFYIFNFVLDPENKGIVLTDLIYAVFNSIAYLLSVTFIIHFSLRAFWVGMVGLVSVYPDGILYDKLTSYGKYYLSRLDAKLGKIDDFIIRLDQVCSVFFSISFMFVILLLGVCWMYLIFLLVIEGFQLFMPEEMYQRYELIIYISLFVVFVVFALFVGILNTKPFRDHSKLKIWHFYLSWRMGNVFFPIIYKPMSFIMFTFFSQTQKKNLIIYGLIIFVFFYINLIFSLSGGQFYRLFESRKFYTTRSEANLMQDKHYDNLLQNEELVTTLTIQNEIIKESYLKLFLAYPRSLDLQLRDFCKTPALADTLNKYTKRDLKAQYNLECISNFFQVYIDDSLYSPLEFVYYENPQSSKKGVLSIVPIENLKSGKHQLKIIPAKAKKDDEKSYLYAIPFWYLPE